MSSKSASTTDRGYGSDHQRARKRLVINPIKQFGFVACITCGKHLAKPSEADLGHDHSDPTHTRYLGPQCHACNRADGGRRGAVATNRRPTAITYDW